MENSAPQFDRMYDDMHREVQTLQSKLLELRNTQDFFKIELLSKQITLITTIQSNLLKLKKLKTSFQNAQT